MAMSRWQKTQYTIVAAALAVVFIVSFAHPGAPKVTKLNNSEENRPWKPAVDSGRHWTAYNMHASVNGTFDCHWMKTNPPVPVCSPPSNNESDLDAHLKAGKVWNEMLIKIIHDALAADEDMGLLDCGAGAGVFSLYSAALGRSTLSVEPSSVHVQAMHQAVKMGHYENILYALHNAISNKHGTYTVINDPSKGVDLMRVDKAADVSVLHKLCSEALSCTETRAVLLDDLVTYVPFQKAVMRIDLAGMEHQAFQNASILFDFISIPVVIIRWDKLRDYYVNEQHVSSDKTNVGKLIKFFSEREYDAFDELGATLSERPWESWPNNIIFIQKDFQSKL